MSELDNLPPVGSSVRWAKCRRGSSLPKEIAMYRTFPGNVTYALLVWTSYGQVFGTPQCEWVKARDIVDYYEEVEP